MTLSLLRRLTAALRGCPRVRLGYRCHADYPGGCEMCGRTAPLRPEFGGADADDREGARARRRFVPHPRSRT